MPPEAVEVAVQREGFPRRLLAEADYVIPAGASSAVEQFMRRWVLREGWHLLPNKVETV